MNTMRQNCGESSCSSGCGGCGGCGQTTLALTEGELVMLRQFAQAPFLPIGGKGALEEPVYLEESDRPAAEYGQILLSLKLKGLIRLDYDLPLRNFDYQEYRGCSHLGSAALTGMGQAALELLEIRGVEA